MHHNPNLIYIWFIFIKSKVFIIYLSLSRRQITNTKLFFKKKNVTNLLPARQSISKLVAIRETSFLKKNLLFESFITSSALNQYLRWKVEVRDIFFSSARSQLTKTKIFLPINEKKKINRCSKIEKLPQ